MIDAVRAIWSDPEGTTIDVCAVRLKGAPLAGVTDTGRGTTRCASSDAMGGMCTGLGRGETTGCGGGAGVERQAAAHISVRHTAEDVIEKREEGMSAERKVLNSGI